MVKSATPDSVNEGDGPPPNIDYVAAVELIQTTIHGIESDQRSLSADAKDAWDQVEQLGVNKVGAQLFSKILKKPVDKRRDEFRTLINLAKAAGWFDWLDDLVDRAQTGPVVKSAPQAPKPVAPEGPKPPKDDKDLAGERVNLKTGWVQRVKEASRDKPALEDDDWEDIRQATPKEMAAERDRLADFDVDTGPKPEPEVAKGRVTAAVKERRAGAEAGDKK